MKIYFGENSWLRAREKSYRLSPDMFKAEIVWRSGYPRFDCRVVGSQKIVYTVRLWKDVFGEYHGDCSCPAGNKMLYCYHLASVYHEYERLIRTGNLFHLGKLRASALFYFAQFAEKFLTVNFWLFCLRFAVQFSLQIRATARAPFVNLRCVKSA